MIDAETIRRLAATSQTTTLNMAREYCQHLVLSSLYQHKAADRILFKGGTALRIIYGSPRFSEDLDFSGFGVRPSAIEELLTEMLSMVERTGIALEIEEAKATSGGYLGIIHGRFLDYHVEIHLEISLRQNRPVSGATALIASDVLPAYTLLHLPQQLLVEEKIQALLTRGKPRDFYDLYFILRKGLLPPKSRRVLAQVLTQVKRTNPEALHELRLFLPKDHQGIIKSFRTTIEQEIHRHLA